jgi:hypothetical protein
LLGIILPPTPKIRACIVFLLVIMRDWKLWRCDNIEWHVVLIKFGDNRASGPKFELIGAMIDFAYTAF